MATVPKPKAVTDMNSPHDSRAKLGKYDDASESIGGRKWTDDRNSGHPVEPGDEEKLAALLQEGLDSGVSELSIFDIWEEVKASMKADGRL